MRARTVLSGCLNSVFRPVNRSVLMRAVGRALMPARRQEVTLERNLKAAYRWLCVAQDATPDGGVSGCYNLVNGWAGSYPETTGYIIPTFLHYADVSHSAEARIRALRMADWENEVQLPDGAVRSGMLGVREGPAVFNTGQVLFGWAAAHAATADARYARAGLRAAQWLMKVQDPDGAWRKHLSVLTTSSVQTYNVRAAWGLALAGREFDEAQCVAAAIRNCDWALTQQLENGWFKCNAFSNAEDPLLHTIGYVLEGLLGVAELTGTERYIRAVIDGVDPLVRLHQTQGTLKGRYDRGWRPSVSWRCLTGEAQVALVLLRLGAITGEGQYRDTARSLIEGIAALQDTSSTHPESYGSVSGSHPIWGGYGPFNYLNWAAKFFMDALLLELYRTDVQQRPRRVSRQASA